MNPQDVRKLKKKLTGMIDGLEGLTEVLNSSIKELKVESLSEKETEQFKEAKKEAANIVSQINDQKKRFEEIISR